MDVGGVVPHVPDYKHGLNKPESEFLTSQAEYSWSCKCLGSCLVVERSMMKSSMLFHVYSSAGPSPPMSTSHSPDVIHVIGVPRPSLFFALFRFRVLQMYTEHKLKNKKTGDAWEQG